MQLYLQIQETVQVIREKWSKTPRVGIVLGTGLGELAKKIEVEATFPYHTLPHFLRSTVQSHSGNFLCGTLCGVPVVAMDGRFHVYEGYEIKELTFPVRVIRQLGAETLVVSNAAGGMNPQYRQGDIVVIEDHINLLGVNPLIGENDERLGPRFPDMCVPYDAKLIDAALAVARREDFVAHKGVYVAVTGPNLETRAEYRFLRGIGADVVGMSTVPEVLVAVHSGMRVLGLSVVTDLCFPENLHPVSLDTIIACANAAEPWLTKIVTSLLPQM